MIMKENTNLNLSSRNAPIAMDAEEFRQAAYKLTDMIVNFMSALPHKAVTPGLKPAESRAILGEASLPQQGETTEEILDQAGILLFEHSLFNGHPSFWGYITSSASPISALADMLASTVNANVGAYALSPMATEIEKQTIKWLSEFIGYSTDAGGIFVSGGNMANFHGFLAARKAKVKENIREFGLHSFSSRLNNIQKGVTEDDNHEQQYKQFTIYCAKGTHTWIQKAAELFGHGINSIRWIGLNEDQQMDLQLLEKQLLNDINQGHYPFLVIGNAGSVGTGTVDQLSGIAVICSQYNLWFHVDGAYGAPAAALPENKALFDGLSKADSIALDPHKWFYSALEAGCILVKNPRQLQEAFSFHPDYYNFSGDGEEEPLNFYEYGMQNSRGFRALKVWMGLKQAGKSGYIDMIRNNISLAQQLYNMAKEEEELEAFTHKLSITTFRYVPRDLKDSEEDIYLNQLNEKLLNSLQKGGKVFLSNAVIGEKYCLRVCIVNFRTSLKHLEALVAIVVEEGRQIDASMRSAYSKHNG